LVRANAIDLAVAEAHDNRSTLGICEGDQRCGEIPPTATSLYSESLILETSDLAVVLLRNEKKLIARSPAPTSPALDATRLV
jgi:hypothetical protein